MSGMNRRELLAAAALAPLGMSMRWLPAGNARCLIVLELEGGNDGLNTVIPLEDEAYAQARPLLSEVRGSALDVGSGLGLHQSMAGMHRLFAADKLAIVHGVGYPRPDRSHFRSRDIWHTADPGFERRSASSSGWLGRAADAIAEQSAVPALSLGGLQVPLAMQGKRVVVPTLEKVEDYQVLVDAGAREEILELVNGAKAEDELRSFLADIGRAATADAERLRQSLAGYQAAAEYPDTALGRSLQLLARILVSGFGTRLFHLSLSGFDTHARQAPAHAGLWQQIDVAVEAFMQDMAAQGMSKDLLLLVHSEFGRRVAENKSQGTDHGAAAPVFLLGDPVKPGLHGDAPSLTDLDDGDLKMSCDFRRVYADMLRWAGLDADLVLGGEHAALGLIS